MLKVNISRVFHKNETSNLTFSTVYNTLESRIAKVLKFLCKELILKKETESYLIYLYWIGIFNSYKLLYLWNAVTEKKSSVQCTRLQNNC